MKTPWTLCEWTYLDDSFRKVNNRKKDYVKHTQIWCPSLHTNNNFIIDVPKHLLLLLFSDMSLVVSFRVSHTHYKPTPPPDTEGGGGFEVCRHTDIKFWNTECVDNFPRTWTVQPTTIGTKPYDKFMLVRKTSGPTLILLSGTSKLIDTRHLGSPFVWESSRIFNSIKEKETFGYLRTNLCLNTPV